MQLSIPLALAAHMLSVRAQYRYSVSAYAPNCEQVPDPINDGDGEKYVYHELEAGTCTIILSYSLLNL